MSDSRFDRFRTEVISALSTKLDPSTIGTVLAAIDILSYKYDIVDKETALVESDDTLKRLAVLYLSCIRQDGRSEATIKSYAQILRKLCFAMHGKTLQDITTMDIRRYILSYQNDHDIKLSTLDHMRVVINSFFEWLKENEYIHKNPCKQINKIRHDRSTRTFISGEDVARLLQACKNARERVIIEVLVGSGIRVSELAGLRMSDINLREGSMTVFGKGRKYRTAYLTPEAIVAIETYVGSVYDRNRYLIQTNNKNKSKVSPRTIQRDVKDIYERAKISIDTDKVITPHVLRHTYATELVSKGCPITSIQKLLGHSSPNTSLVYAHVSNDVVHQDFMRYR